MKKIFILLLSAWNFTLLSLANVSRLPERTVENVADGVIVTYKFENPIIRPNHLAPGSYLWEYMGFGVNDTPGEPAIPYRSDMFYIPAGYKAQITLLDSTYRDTTIVLSPAIPCRLRNDMSESIDIIKPYHGFFPENVIMKSALDDYRGVGILRVVIMPIQYDNERHLVRLHSKIKYKITYIQNVSNARGTTNSKHESRKTRDFLSRITLNYNDSPASLTREVNNTIADTTNYLIITINEYLDSIQSFVEWKRIKGNNIFIQTKNRGEWTTDSIKNAIHYTDSLHPLDYVLMIGNFEDVPADIYTYEAHFIPCHAATDFAYGFPTHNLQIPTISRGRIPVDNAQELSNVLKKIVKYERTPIKNDSFYRKSLHCGEFSDYNRNKYEDDCFILTLENIREHLLHTYGLQISRSYYFLDYVGIPATTDILHWNDFPYSYGAALPDSLQPSVYNWKVNQVLQKINEGTFYVLYNGHGYKSGWQAPDFTSDVNLLQNGDKQPIVFSLACLTGKYNENGDCFVEKMLKNTDGGCVGIFAASEETFPGYDDAMAYGMFDAIWPNLQLTYDFNSYDPLVNPYTPFGKAFYELGRILDLGFLRMSETFGLFNSKKTEITKRLYHYFGDPSMMIYTDVPQEFYIPNIKYINGKICVQSPCDSTRITFYTPSDTNPIIDTYIGESYEYETNADSVIICLDKHNYVPYVQTFHKNLYIQNETINNTRKYVGDNILIGNHVTSEKPAGNVLIENANVSIQGNSVELHPGTKIIHSCLNINTR